MSIRTGNAEGCDHAESDLLAMQEKWPRYENWTRISSEFQKLGKRRDREQA